MSTDTIFAIASGRGASGVAVIRVSGTQALSGLATLSSQKDIQPRHATLCALRDPVSCETLDHALILTFPAPHSYTGEDVVEYHTHGGRAVTQDTLNALAALPGHRMAQPGEFTRRAFENGKMDLTEAEAIADLIHAETSLQKNQALAQMAGGLSALYHQWRDQLTTLLAYVEAELEFPDEDVPDDIITNIGPKIEAIITDINAHLNDNRRGERLRDGLRVAVIGAPNAGKSSLVNALAQRDVAIVSDIAGTTRDVIDVHLDLNGYPVIISDTAGLRPHDLGTQDHDKIEAEGIKRALDIANNADIRVIVYDGTVKTRDAHSVALEKKPHTLVIINKADQDIVLEGHDHDVKISAKENNGLSLFIDALSQEASRLIGTSDAPSLTRTRHREALINTVHALSRCLVAPMPELTAEDIRIAIRDLGHITGRVDVEEILDVVFRDFCIGK